MKTVLVLGFPASGKTTVTQQFVDQGFIRLNRDDRGGTIIDLIPLMEKALKNKENVVLDNLFATVDSRAPFIAAAKKCGAEVECHWMQTTIEEAQFNYCMRSMKHHGEVLASKSGDPGTFPPAVIFKYRKEFQKPNTDEGFSKIEKVKFQRIMDAEYVNKALILDYDGTLRNCVGGNGKFPVSQDQVELLPGRTEKLTEYKKQGYILCGASNQSGVAKGDLTEQTATELFEYTNKLLKHDIDFQFDTSAVPPIRSWSRKPLPGLGVHFVHKYKLNPYETIMVGDLKSDETFAKRCNFQFVHADEFFK